MPKCKYCHGNITKFDKEQCPLCGALRPLDENSEETSDITRVIDTLTDEEKEHVYKPRSHKANSLLLMFLGMFGVDAFYLGFFKYGIIRLVVNLVLYGVLFVVLYFFVFTANILLSALIPFGVLFVIYFIFGIISFFKTPIKDSNGVFLK